MDDETCSASRNSWMVASKSCSYSCTNPYGSAADSHTECKVPQEDDLEEPMHLMTLLVLDVSSTVEYVRVAASMWVPSSVFRV